jgi:Fe-S cluster assembly ATPase SufC
VLLDGRIVATGGIELAERIEAEGFDTFRRGQAQRSPGDEELATARSGAAS